MKQTSNTLDWIYDQLSLIKNGNKRAINLLDEKNSKKRLILKNLLSISSNYSADNRTLNPFFEDFTTPVVLLSQKGVIYKSNDAYNELISSEKEDVEFQYITSLFPKKEKIKIFNSLQLFNLQGELYNVRLSHVCKDQYCEDHFWSLFKIPSLPFYLLVGHKNDGIIDSKYKEEVITHFFKKSMITLVGQNGIILKSPQQKSSNNVINTFYLEGKDFLKLSKKALSEIDFKTFNQTYEGNSFWSGIVGSKISKLNTVWTERTFIKLQNPLKEGTCKIIVDYDVSNRIGNIGVSNSENVEGSYRQFTSLKNALDEFAIVAITDQKGTIKYVNQKFCDISKYTKEELIGNNHRILKSDEHSLEFFKNFYATIAKGKIWRNEVKNFNKYGETYWVDTLVVPFMNAYGKPYEYVSLRVDITDRKKTEEQLKQSLHEIKHAAKSRQLLFSKLSHEIRTPMNAILGYTDLLIENNPSKIQEEYLKTIKEAGDSLLVLINEILDFTKLESDKLRLESVPFNLDQVVCSTVNMLRVNAEKKSLSLIVSPSSKDPINIVGDPLRIRQVLVNLISNAIKFTDRGSVSIKYGIQSETKSHYRLVFEIIDTGIGIAKNKQDKIFQEFNQENNSISRYYGGSGLGLSIVKIIVQKYKGAIQVISTPKKGSTFKFDLRLKKAQDVSAIKNIFEEKPDYTNYLLNGLSVLVLEDNVINQKIIKTRLEKWNCDVVITDKGTQAINLLEERFFHLVLMDLQMPQMSGYDVTKLIRNHSQDSISNIPIIAQTAEGGKRLIEKIKEAGMNDYLSKPFNVQLLFDKLVAYSGITPTLINPESIQGVQKNSKNNSIDLKFLIQETDNDPQMMHYLISTFISHLKEYVQKMERALETEDWEQIHQESHKMKPSIKMFGLEAFYLIHDQIVESSRIKENTDMIAQWFRNQKELLDPIYKELTLSLNLYES